MNKDAKKYYRDIKSVIPSGGHQEKRLIKDYKIRITELNEMNPYNKNYTFLYLLYINTYSGWFRHQCKY